MPRRYRGRDLIWWLSALGLDRTPVERRAPDTTLPLITGAYGGHTIDFREFARQDVILLGRLVSGRDGILNFASDLVDSLAREHLSNTETDFAIVIVGPKERPSAPTGRSHAAAAPPSSDMNVRRVMLISPFRLPLGPLALATQPR
jgi:hypothetical protein